MCVYMRALMNEVGGLCPQYNKSGGGGRCPPFPPAPTPLLRNGASLAEFPYAQCACALSAGKMADLMYSHRREGALDLGNTWVLEKTLQIFDLRCPLSR